MWVVGQHAHRDLGDDGGNTTFDYEEPAPEDVNVWSGVKSSVEG